jgi:hypothetical protein
MVTQNILWLNRKRRKGREGLGAGRGGNDWNKFMLGRDKAKNR